VIEICGNIKAPMTKNPNPNKIPMTNTQAPIPSEHVVRRFRKQFGPFWEMVIGAWDLTGIWPLGRWDLRRGGTAETVAYPRDGSPALSF
jgi:hypothetical protein